MNNYDEYHSLVEILKQALLFYANEKNYVINDKNSSLIELDFGSQAKFAITKINDFNNFEQNINNSYADDKYVDDLLSKTFSDDLKKMINKYKDI